MEETWRFCSLPRRPKLTLPIEVTRNRFREYAIISNADKWPNRTVLHYAFFETPPWAVPASQRQVIRKAFETWKSVGIGLSFKEVSDLREAEVRIGFDTTREGGGSWSAVGLDVKLAAVSEPTMNFGWRLDQTAYGFTTALHEIGHSLGMSHEHQNPRSGIVWNEKKVYEYFAGEPNYWDPDKTRSNVLEKLSEWDYTGSQWDSTSVMEYPFPAGLIDAPTDYRGGVQEPVGLSPLDIQYVRQWYPDGYIDFGHAQPAEQAEPFLRVNSPATVQLVDGQQADFAIEVETNREYSISAFNAKDMALSLFEDIGDDTKFLVGDDDSGTDATAAIKYRLRPGRTYHLRLRLVYQGSTGPLTVLMW